ncbi:MULTISPECIES: ABC transporter permease [Cyanophyceae]|uniref:cell division protein FtsX n=1 Tax=Cyanophyceae TaxID=3028117 RepID=UPI001681EE4E|nr:MULTISPECIES: ABC transporter permease [Cyanophyceae]MBD1914768.1 ABC transporter permease [Phormidium sp. FACHB-77]MBD2030871.1 ABC transporter permease [Phormidium sp. FACHB-322]MBD2052470.1 ABC transporter permease [Leptolyngbya sp. FACHB-60]
MFKLFTKFDYLLRETFLGLRRGGWMNWAAISTITVLLFLFGISLQSTWQLERLLNQFGSQLEVSAYLQSGFQASDLKPVVEGFPNVMAVTPVTKEAAWASLVADLGLSDIAGATDQLKGNPLVDELKVKAKDSESVPAIASQLQSLDGIDEVRYVDEAVTRLAQLNDGLKWTSLFVITILTLTATAVITTTIRLIVLARKREIEVMQLVGATRIWIYLPFILQGATFGLAGATVAWGLLFAIQRFLTELATQQADFIQFVVQGLRLTPQQLILLPASLLGLGTLVGLMGSLLAVRKFSLR